MSVTLLTLNLHALCIIVCETQISCFDLNFCQIFSKQHKYWESISHKQVIGTQPLCTLQSFDAIIRANYQQPMVSVR